MSSQAVLQDATPPPFVRTHTSNVLLSRQLDGLPHRVVSSPFVQSILVGSILSGFVALTARCVMLNAPVSETFPLGVMMAATAVALYVLIEQKKDVIWFDSSLLFINGMSVLTRFVNKHVTTSVQAQQWYNQIPTTHPGDNQLVLGAIPFINKGHHLRILELPGNKSPAVLSVLSHDENHHSKLLGDPVRPEDWKQLGVVHMQIPVRDLKPITPEEIDRGVEFIRKHLMEGRSIYAHCKAGQGRSCLMTAAYLSKYERDLLQRYPGEDIVHRALSLIRSVRPQIYITTLQLNALYDFEAFLLANNHIQDVIE